tara:strand:- start:477 stop:3242 length:2766 start_codon:yes stop_codon:yes gene_type:complete
MIRSQFGDRTIDGLNTAEFDRVNIQKSAESLTFNDYGGTAGQVLQKDSSNEPEWKTFAVSDDSITGGMLTDDISIITTGSILLQAPLGNTKLSLAGNGNITSLAKIEGVDIDGTNFKVLNDFLVYHTGQTTHKVFQVLHTGVIAVFDNTGNPKLTIAAASGALVSLGKITCNNLETTAQIKANTNLEVVGEYFQNWAGSSHKFISINNGDLQMYPNSNNAPYKLELSADDGHITSLGNIWAKGGDLIATHSTETTIPLFIADGSTGIITCKDTSNVEKIELQSLTGNITAQGIIQGSSFTTAGNSQALLTKTNTLESISGDISVSNNINSGSNNITTTGTITSNVGNFTTSTITNLTATSLSFTNIELSGGLVGQKDVKKYIILSSNFIAEVLHNTISNFDTLNNQYFSGCWFLDNRYTYRDISGTPTLTDTFIASPSSILSHMGVRSNGNLASLPSPSSGFTGKVGYLPFYLEGTNSHSGYFSKDVPFYNQYNSYLKDIQKLNYQIITGSNNNGGLHQGGATFGLFFVFSDMNGIFGNLPTSFTSTALSPPTLPNSANANGGYIQLHNQHDSFTSFSFPNLTGGIDFTNTNTLTEAGLALLQLAKRVGFYLIGTNSQSSPSLHLGLSNISISSSNQFVLDTPRTYLQDIHYINWTPRNLLGNGEFADAKNSLNYRGGYYYLDIDPNKIQVLNPQDTTNLGNGMRYTIPKLIYNNPVNNELLINGNFNNSNFGAWVETSANTTGNTKNINQLIYVFQIPPDYEIVGYFVDIKGDTTSFTNNTLPHSPSSTFYNYLAYYDNKEHSQIISRATDINGDVLNFSDVSIANKYSHNPYNTEIEVRCPHQLGLGNAINRYTQEDLLESGDANTNTAESINEPHLLSTSTKLGAYQYQKKFAIYFRDDGYFHYHSFKGGYIKLKRRE